MSNTGHVGSSFDDFLAEEGLYEQANTTAIKRVLAWQIEHLMEEQDLSKAAMAKRMHTSRAAVNRLLDPENESVTLQTLQRAAQSVGKHIKLELVD